MTAPDPGFVFIAGAPRSGTSALADYLNRDPRFAVGMERFKYSRTRITPQSFLDDSFFSPTAEDTNLIRPQLYDKLRQRRSDGSIAYVGDKVPYYTTMLPALVQRFPGCKILYTHRDIEPVAASFQARADNTADSWPAENGYRAAVDIWNDFLGRVRSFVEERGHGGSLHVVSHRDFFSGDEQHLAALYDFLGLEVTDRARTAFAAVTKKGRTIVGRTSSLSDDARSYLQEHKDADAEAWVEGWLRRRLGSVEPTAQTAQTAT